MRGFLLVTIIILSLVSLFGRMRPKEDVKKSAADYSTEEITQSPALKSNVFNVTIKDKVVEGVPEVIEINQGEEITFIIASDTKDELHIHGYEEFVHISQGDKSTLMFTADISGRFPAELHSLGKEVTILVVNPL